MKIRKGFFRMKKKLLFTSILWVLISMVEAGPLTEISYEAEQLSGQRWAYNYNVSNIGLVGGIHEFTIWFDYSKYNNLVIETPLVMASSWDEMIWQPKPLLEDNGGYDVLALSNAVSLGQSVTGFRVSFDWLGTEQPGSQFYEIISPSDYSVIEHGYTVPEPTTMAILALGTLMLKRKRV